MYIIICKVQRALSKIKINKCASGSGVEYNLAKVGVAGSNPVSRSTGNRNAYTFRFLRCGKIDEKEILFLKLKNIAF